MIEALPQHVVGETFRKRGLLQQLLQCVNNFCTALAQTSPVMERVVPVGDHTAYAQTPGGSGIVSTWPIICVDMSYCTLYTC